MISNRQTRGYTLIELLVVIAIIGLLASVVVADLNSARMKSRDARRLADLHQIRLALEAYASDHQNVYPSPRGDTTWYWISDNNYPTSVGWTTYGSCYLIGGVPSITNGLENYLVKDICGYKDPQRLPYAYTSRPDGSVELGAYFELSQNQGPAFTKFDSSGAPMALTGYPGLYQPKY